MCLKPLSKKARAFFMYSLQTARKKKMKTDKIFTEAQKNKAVERWGSGFDIKILRDIEFYSKKWKLSEFQFAGHYSFNAIFFCASKQRSGTPKEFLPYGSCVLKIGGNEQDAEFFSECNVLREYGGGRYVKVYESDIDINKGKKAMLLERVMPGNRLREEQSLEKRLEIFSELFNGLHIEPKNPGSFSTYEKWVCEMTDLYCNAGARYEKLCGHMKKARELYFDIAQVYSKKVLLHGDFHADNIISSGGGFYKIIDPKGIIGDPVFDVSRYIANESPDAKNRFANAAAIIKRLEKSLQIPEKILRQCFYIEMAMVNGWSDEDGGPVKIDNLIYAEKLMNE